MARHLQLSVVDQSPVRAGGTAAEALQETIALAVATEAMGYHRYWVAEHHNLPNFASTSPEVLIGQIAARTRTIRVGSGGIMLPHYSAFKVAENFRLLESLYPGRIDLGLGRAPGSDQLTAIALAYPGRPRDAAQYPQQVMDLIGFLSASLPPDHPFTQIRPGPSDGTMPEIWLLGSQSESAYMAAMFGLPFSYAQFFGIGSHQGPAIVENYRQHFKPSALLAEPRVNVAVHVLCAETEEKARRLAASRNLAKLKTALNQRGGVPPIEAALNYPYTREEQAYIEQFSQNYIDGDPQQVRDKLEAVSELYQTTDISIVTICYNFEDRVRSYELVAEACGLKG